MILCAARHRKLWYMVQSGAMYAYGNFMVYYSERIHVEAAVYAGQMIESGAIGTPLHTDGFGPHRMGDPKVRPEWFFPKDKYGGIWLLTISPSRDMGNTKCPFVSCVSPSGTALMRTS